MRLFMLGWKWTQVLMASIALSGCHQGSGGSSSPAQNISSQGSAASTLSTSVEGVDLSGTYNLKAVQCFDSSTVALVASALVTIPNGGEALTINGNSMTAVDSDPNCVATEEDHVVFNAPGADGLGIVTLSVGSTATSTGGVCTFPLVLTPDGGTGTIVGPSAGFIDSPGNSRGVATGSYVQDQSQGLLEIATLNFTVQGSATDQCLTIYLK